MEIVLKSIAKFVRKIGEFIRKIRNYPQSFRLPLFFVVGFEVFVDDKFEDDFPLFEDGFCF